MGVVAPALAGERLSPELTGGGVAVDDGSSATVSREAG